MAEPVSERGSTRWEGVEAAAVTAAPIAALMVAQGLGLWAAHVGLLERTEALLNVSGNATWMLGLALPVWALARGPQRVGRRLFGLLGLFLAPLLLNAFIWSLLEPIHVCGGLYVMGSLAAWTLWAALGAPLTTVLVRALARRRGWLPAR